jgi:hypothetical protein
MRRRPPGIAVVATLLCVGAALNFVFAVLSIIAYPLVARALWAITVVGTHGPAALLRLGPLLPLYFVALAVFLASLAIGLLQLRNWARLTTMVLLVVSLVISFMQVSLATRQVRMAVLAEFVLRLCVNAALFFYLAKPSVRGAFRNPAIERRRSERVQPAVRPLDQRMTGSR